MNICVRLLRWQVCILCCALLLAIASARTMAQDGVQSGVYDSLTLGVDDFNKTITGYYESATGLDETTQKPMFTCAFYLYGTRMNNGTYKLISWYPGEKDDVINGELMAVAGGVQIKLETEHGGCGMVQHFADATQPAIFKLDKAGDWRGVRVVSADKAFFYPEAKAVTPGKAYVIKNNIVRVYGARSGGDWLEVEYGDKKPKRGWLQNSDLFPATPGDADDDKD